jgi:PAS domain S-box-containing protein
VLPFDVCPASSQFPFDLGQALIDSTDAVVLVVDGQGRIALFNRAAERLTGYAAAEILGQPAVSFLNDPAEAQGALDRLARLRAGEARHEATTTWITRSGERKRIAWSTTVVPGTSYIVSTGVDITQQESAGRELRAQEARLRAILETAVEAIITIRSDGSIESFNPAAERLFGYRADEVIGRNVSLLMPEPHRGAHDGYIRRYLDTGERRIIGIGREVRGRRRDGSEVHVDLAVSEAMVEGKRLFVGALRDIGARKLAEGHVQRAQRLESVAHLTGGVAHDFNNLLTVVLGNLELLGDRVEGEAAELVSEAKEAAELGARLTRQLLSFARRQPLQADTVDLNEVVVGVTELLRRTLGEHVLLRSTLASDLPHIRVDRSQLESAIVNLAVNAKDAMPRGGPITLTTGLADRREKAVLGVAPDAGFVCLRVRDEGEGMPPEVQRRAFEPFFTTKSGSGGTGLGLSMVYGFVTQSQGYALIESAPGRGTEVSMFFPAGPSQLRSSSDPVRDTTKRTGAVILIVEDNGSVRLAAKRQLEGLGYVVREAADGRSALAMVDRDESIDLLFTDVVMPGGIDGFELADKARLRRPGLKVLLTTGYAASEALAETTRKGLAVLSKPYSREALAQAVRAVLR